MRTSQVNKKLSFQYLSRDDIILKEKNPNFRTTI